MKKIDNLRYVAEDGYLFVEKKTGKRFGSRIYLGMAAIDEFEEQPMTDEEKKTENSKKEDLLKHQNLRKNRH